MTDIKTRLGDYHHALSSGDRQIALERIEELEREVDFLRRFGNKDCTAMADEALDKTRPVAKVAWRYRPVTLGDAIERIEELEAIGKRLLYHDERGQGVGWQEAMHDLAITLK